MNAVEIEEAVSELAAAPFDPAEFPFAFLTAFGNKATTVNRLRTPSLNKSDVAGGVLQARNIHLAVCAEGLVRETMAALRESPKTAANKVKFLLATDGVTLEAEDLVSDEPPIVCDYPKFAEHFGFFLALAGISTVRAIKNNPIDIKATGRLNKLYVELLKENPEWSTEARRYEMNQFMARLIFCFFAEDTGIFENHLFTKKIEQMSDSRSDNTHEVLQELFRAMATPTHHEGKLDGRYRKATGIKNWADAFPFVNGGLFPEAGECPRFSRIARSYLLRAAELNWQEINPDIFGSMIQAVADDEERGELGMHYTSVPNILKVLNPLFLDDLREQLAAAGDNLRKLRNLRKRLGTIRVFDPACGSGNFLVIAYREMRQIEHEIVKRTGDAPKSVIPLANFYGIEIKGFAAEIARLALLIAEFQCDVRLISQKEARLNVLPLHKTGQIHIGNALRTNWLEVCPPTGSVDQEKSDLENISSSTYICGNPPYLGAKKKSSAQVEDMEIVGLGSAKLLDYVCAFIVKGLPLVSVHGYEMALVSTSSICQGEQVSLLWPNVLDKAEIKFAYRPFKWSNSAANNAGVFCTIVGLQSGKPTTRRLFLDSLEKKCSYISPYLVEGEPVICFPQRNPLSDLAPMVMGSNAVDGKRLILTSFEFDELIRKAPEAAPYLKKYGGTEELTSGSYRWCVWVEDKNFAAASRIPALTEIFEQCRNYRIGAGRDAQKAAKRPHAFCYSTFQNEPAVHVGNTIGNAYFFVPATLREAGFVSNHMAFTVYGIRLLELAVIVSTIHRVWAESIAGRLGNGTRYGNTVVYNTFPLPPLTEKNKSDLTRCAEDILLAREAHFPSTIADLYDPENMPDDLSAAHDRNDETLERIYIGRRFRNDTERLEKLFDLYTKMTADKAPKKPAKEGAA